MKISIATPRCAGRLEAVGCGWIYADDDLNKFRLVREVLGKPGLLVSAEAFQQAALDLQAPFVCWVDECMRTTPRSYWLATPLSKNPFESNLFLHLVWMVVLDRAIKQEKNGIVVVTESHGLALALAELCRIRGWECKRYGKTSSLFRHGRRNFVAFAKWLGKLLLLGYRAIVAKSLFTDKFVTARLASTELLLETYIYDGDMRKDGGCEDRHFLGLMAYYRAQDIKASYFPLLYRIPFLRLRKTYAAMKQSGIPFVPFEAFVTFRDVALAAWASLRYGLFSRLPTLPAFQGMPASVLARTECFASGLRSIMPFALSYAPRRMAKAGVKPKWFIDWFENQALDKGIVLGLKEGLPECRVIAVRQYAPLSNFLSLFSTSGEVKAGVASSENWVCGEALIPLFSRFDNVGRYSAVPALRYAYLHQAHPAITLGNTLLVLLTHSAEESLGILDCVAPLCREEGAGASHFVVKTHPDMNLELFRRKAELRFPALKANIVEWSNRKLNELLPSARVVVTSGSSTALEAICCGIPVALIGCQAGLNFNPLWGIDPKMWLIVYSSTELKAAIAQRFCEEHLPSAERLSIAEHTRKAFFMETGNDEMCRFLPTN